MDPQPAHIAQWYDAAAEALRGLSWSAHIGLLAPLALGLMLWLFGNRFLRAGFVLLGAGALGCLCFLAPPALELNVNPGFTAIAGAVGGALIGWLLFRLTVAATLGVILSLGLGLGAATWEYRSAPMEAGAAPSMEPESEPTDSEAAGRSATDAIPTTVDLSAIVMQAAGQPPLSRVETDIAATARQLEELVTGLAERAVPIWNSMPRRSRLIITGVTALGLLIGLCVGLGAPRRSAAVSTALAGPLLWLPAALGLAAAFEAPVARILPDSPGAWALAWGVLAAIGIAVQWRPARPSTDKG